MSHVQPPQVPAQLRMVPMPRDTNGAGAIFGGWTLSQMDLAGGMFAFDLTGKRVVTARIEAMDFLAPVTVGDDVSLYCHLEEQGETSIKVRIETWARKRSRGEAVRVTEGVFTYVCLGDDGKPELISP